MTYPGESICAWCHDLIGIVEGFSEPGQTTHGMCRKCFKEQMDWLNNSE